MSSRAVKRGPRIAVVLQIFCVFPVSEYSGAPLLFEKLTLQVSPSHGSADGPPQSTHSEATAFEARLRPPCQKDVQGLGSVWGRWGVGGPA